MLVQIAPIAFRVLVVALVGTTLAAAQNAMGGVSGTVIDARAGTVPGATVTFTQHGLHKNVLAGGPTLQVRAAAFNVFNHINWGNLAVAIDNPAHRREDHVHVRTATPVAVRLSAVVLADTPLGLDRVGTRG